MKKIKSLRLILCAGGGLLLLNAVVLSFFSNMNMGLIMLFVLGFALVLFGALPEQAVQKIPKWIKAVFFTGLCLLLAFAVFLLGYGLHDTVNDDEEAIVVLGCGIRGETMTQGLKNRLDAALECYERNSGAVIVVSGGQGPQEDITEALAMERYLLSCGVPKEKIIKEEQSTSTYENFFYSKQILDERFGSDYKICFATNEYHILRSSFLAKSAGFDEVTHVHTSTLYYTLLPGCFRECLAVAWWGILVVFGKN